MILLDTKICIHVVNVKPPAALARFQQYRMGDIGVCSVVAAELAFGVAKSGSARNREALLVTNNTREFARVPGLRLDNWVDTN